jgi:general secretion pathway protein B
LTVSFILEALRKSESERQRDAAPSLSRIPEAAAARGLPRWAAGTIALLGLGVIGLGAALWFSGRGTAAGPAAAGNGFERQMPASAASTQPGDGATAEPALVTEPTGPGVVRTENEPAAARGENEPTPAASSLEDDPAPELLPSYETAAASDGSLPKLNLEFHAFANDPARRFVYINGEKYQEGSRLEQGLRVVRITSDGVILEAAGKKLLLSRK